jgi:hypothetical protein
MSSEQSAGLADAAAAPVRTTPVAAQPQSTSSAAPTAKHEAKLFVLSAAVDRVSEGLAIERFMASSQVRW